MKTVGTSDDAKHRRVVDGGRRARSTHERSPVVARRNSSAQTLTGSVSSPSVSRALTAKEKEKEKEGRKKRRHERGRDRLWKRE